MTRPPVVASFTHRAHRAEPDGGGDGRVYQIVYTACGGSCSGVVSVVVPHDHGGEEAVDSGQFYVSTDGCE